MPVRILLIGPPGVGKGTQAALLQDRFGAVPLASGNIFRQQIADGTELGLTAKRFMDAGQLVPDEVTIGMMETYLSAPEVTKNGFILDGFPRTVEQARALDGLLTKLGQSVDKVVMLKVADSVVIERLSGRLSCPNCGAIYHVRSKPPEVDGICDVCGASLTVRDDDKPEVIANRLAVFRKATEPVAAYYRERGNLHEVEGDLPAEAVHQLVAAGLEG